MIPFHTETNMKVLTSTTCVQRSDDSRVLQFALRIAFRCVLHRHGNLDIHRWKFSFRFWIVSRFIKINVFFSHKVWVLINRIALKATLLVHKLRCNNCVNDPSAGSPTDTLLRLLVVPNGRVYLTSCVSCDCSPEGSPDHSLLQATGGVYKRQGHNQRKLMTCTY